jgi:hypothetical protein
MPLAADNEHEPVPQETPRGPVDARDAFPEPAGSETYARCACALLIVPRAWLGSVRCQRCDAVWRPA